MAVLNCPNLTGSSVRLVPAAPLCGRPVPVIWTAALVSTKPPFVSLGKLTAIVDGVSTTLGGVPPCYELTSVSFRMSQSRRLNTVRIALIICGACVEAAYLRGCLLLLFASFLDSGIRTLVGTTLCIGSSHFRWASYSLHCWHVAFLQSGAENDSAFIFGASSNGSIDVLAKLRTRTGRHTTPVQCLEI